MEVEMVKARWVKPGKFLRGTSVVRRSMSPDNPQR